MENAHLQTSEAGALEQCHFNPSYPTPDTQAARLLAVALLNQKINPLRGWVNLGIYRLSDTKFRLKEMGWPMESGRLDVANKFGESCHVALYGLPEWAIEQAGERGQEFAQCELANMNRRRAA
jgi:hypothetical protein